jgi:F-type H+-transporting ATPase subunit b
MDRRAAIQCGAPGSLGGKEATPMPQLDFGNPLMIAQIVWLLIIFGLLYYVLSAYALPRVESVLEERRTRIASDLEAAQAAKAEADAAMTAHREATAKARAEAQSAIAAAMQQAQAEAAARSDALNAKLARQIEEAEARIAQARDAAMGALRQVSSETATSLVAKLTGKADQAAVGAAVDRALAARAQG